MSSDHARDALEYFDREAIFLAMREDGEANDLFERLARDPLFSGIRDRFAGLSDPAGFVGRAPEQVDEFLADVLQPALRHAQPHLDAWGGAADESGVRV